MATIAIVDGLGGGLGAQLVGKLREAAGNGAELIALGTNSAATERMIKAGADRGASGENAIRVSAAGADLILGPIGIVIPDSMMGEITLAMATAILAAPGKRILLPLQQSHFSLAGIPSQPIAKLIDAAVAEALEALAQGQVIR